ncbi:MAG: aldehyde dehydrogenase family protein [Planctomycetes bacterium]|nr:aldehyde dehydrogenase family protein [Planctomycetota bacterium]
MSSPPVPPSPAGLPSTPDSLPAAALAPAPHEELGLHGLEPGTFAGRWLTPGAGAEIVSVNPATAEPIGRVCSTTAGEHRLAVGAAASELVRWRAVPAPRRGELVREIGEALRARKRALGRLVSEEAGKILSEGEGEVQEMIDIAEYALGLSRSLGGRTFPSERARHRLIEEWHPLGPVAVITAFNFPVAVWAWNALIAAVCGDTVIWKPSEKTPLCALAVMRIVGEVMARAGFPAVFNLVSGGPEAGERLASDPAVPLVSATGSCRMGRKVAEAVARRLGRTLLELGGNNAAVVLDDADLDLTLRAIVFGAVGTAGQRCTSTRRLIVQRGIADRLEERLLKAYASIRAGDPLEPGTILGPLIDEAAVRAFEEAVERARREGGEVLCGGRRIPRRGFYVEPTMVRARPDMPVVGEETFAPILYVLRVKDLDEAIGVHNAVRQGLSSAIFTASLRAAEAFLSASGSDCGIANVNCGTSGAEIGGAFGGEKETGGGREAGSDAWKVYMRRQTCTINHGTDLPLAQGVVFDV